MAQRPHRLRLAYDPRSPIRREGRKPVPAASVADVAPDRTWVVHDAYDLGPGGRVLHAQQYHRGLRVYRSVLAIREEGAGLRATAPLHDIPAQTSTRATTAPRQALARALEFLERRGAVRKGTRLVVERETRFGQLVELPTVIVASRTFAEPVRMHLEMFVLAADSAEVAWVIEAELRNGIRFECLVSAGRKRLRVLHCQQTNICLGFDATWVRQPGTAPRTDPCPLPPIASPTGAPASPSRWLDGGTQARGRNVACHLSYRSSPEKLGNPLVDTPFVWCNLLRDLFHEFGFEGDRYGFEDDDPLRTRRFKGALQLGAECRLDSDGHQIYLDLYDSPHGGSHAVLDPGILIHEYAHAVTNRLLGGGKFSNPFFDEEGKGLDEGYADYFALSILGYLWRQGSAAPFVRKLGSAFQPGTGVRDYTAFAGKWRANLGDRYEIGKVWCGALLAARDAIAARAQPDAADRFMWQALIESLKAMLPICPASDRLTLAHAKDALLGSATALSAAGGIPGAATDIRTAFAGRNL